MPKLTEGQRCAALADYLDGMLLREIASKYGVSIQYPTTLARRSGLTLRRHRPKAYPTFKWRRPRHVNP